MTFLPLVMVIPFPGRVNSSQLASMLTEGRILNDGLTCETSL